MPSLTVAQIAALCHASFEGDSERLIEGANALEDADPTQLSFVGSPSAVELSRNSRAGCLIVKRDFSETGPWAVIRVEEPRSSFAKALTVLYAKAAVEQYRHPTAVIDATACIGDDAHISAHVVVGARSSVGKGCFIGAGSSIGDDVSIGDGSYVHATVTIYGNVRIGARAVIHSGCVIGADGFGFARVGGSYQKFPQVGTVVIGDDVELGANTCIDRAALGQTVIGDGSKLDNLVHVAHNVRIGRNVVIAAQTGFSGGVTVGDGAVIGGQVGIGDKVKIDGGAVVGSGSGILTGAHVRSGEPVWGTPARPLRSYLKSLANLKKIEELRTEVKNMKQQLGELLQERTSEGKRT